VSAALHTVHVRVNAAASGQPTPVRIRFSAPAGEYFAPFGRLTDFATARYQDVGGNVLLNDRQYAHIDGTCEVYLPASPIVVEISKGPEYRPIRRDLSLGPGKLALRFAMDRWTDLRAQGWCSGDANALLPMPHAALLEGAAEDLAVINLLAREVKIKSARRNRHRRAIPNILAFSGQAPALAV